MLRFLKRIVAGKELDELERWRVHWQETRQWLAAFPDAAAALDYLQTRAEGYEQIPDLREIRDRMRERHCQLQKIHDAALEDAAAIAMDAPITADMTDSDDAKAVAFHAAARIRRLKHERAGRPDCWRCFKESGRSFMEARVFVCPTCGHKRCPKASDHRLACTGSNEPGQPGSVY